MAKVNLGRVGFVMQGNHSTSKTYKRLDCVTSNGVMYSAKEDVPTGIAINNETYWQKIFDGEEVMDSKMERYVIKLTKNGETYSLTDIDNQAVTFNSLYNTLRDLSKYVVCVYGNSKLRPQYVSTNEMLFIGLDRASSSSKVLRMHVTPTAIRYETFELAEKSYVDTELNKKASAATMAAFAQNLGNLEGDVDELKGDIAQQEQRLTALDNGGGGLVDAQVEEIENAIILSSGAIYTPMNGWSATDFVDIGERTKNDVQIHATVYGSGSVGLYDENKSIISYINGTNAANYGITAGMEWQTFTVNAADNIRYIRASGYNDTRPQGDKIKVSYMSAGQKPWISDIETASAGLNEKITDVDSKIGETKYTNLVNPADIETSMFVAGATGAVSASGYFNATGFIALSANTRYFVGNLYCDGNMFAFYSDKKVSSFMANPDVTVNVIGTYKAVINVGASDVYCRWSINKSHTNDLYISDVYDYYVPFGNALTLPQIFEKKHKCHYDKVLVMGDSISTDAYGNYKKWVTMLMEDGYLPADTVNNSQNATGFVARYDNKPNDFITRIKAVQNPEQYDLVIVFGGINDYIQNKPFGSDTDTDYLTYVKPAVKEFYNYLTTNFINARIAILTPLAIKESAYPNDHGSVNDYSDYYMSVIKEYRLPVLDLTYKSGLNPNIEAVNVRWMLEPMPDKYPGIHDGVHPTEEYIRKFLVPMIRGFLESI